MDRISVTQAARQFSDILNRVYYQGVSIELERGNKVIAQITPIRIASTLTAQNLNDFFAKLPSLGDDIDDFAEDLDHIRQTMITVKDEWD